MALKVTYTCIGYSESIPSACIEYRTNFYTQTLSAKAAAALDKELMSTGAFSLDQLMELAGLSVSQVGQSPQTSSVSGSSTNLCAVYRVHPPSKGRNVLVACGPGNNGQWLHG